MDINAINHAKTMYVSLHGLCDVISFIGFFLIVVLQFLIFKEYYFNKDKFEIFRKRGFKKINLLSTAIIILSILIIPSLIIPSYYKSQLVVSGMSDEQIGKLLGK